jgi:hypothetical protein
MLGERPPFHRPNLIGADLGGPKWNPIDPSEIMRTAFQFTESSDFRNSGERLVEYLKDNISESFFKVFPEAIAPMSVLDEASVRRYLKSEDCPQYSLSNLKQFGADKWINACWACPKNVAYFGHGELGENGD